eukprot:Sspe_Gene.24980::Locus_9980_Transcript_1_1_Confidence_1.000_Length_1170::g.24980::m.24980
MRRLPGVVPSARSYHTTSERPPAFDYFAAARSWKQPKSCKSVSELYRTIQGPLTECEDILSTWREAKWFNREVDSSLREDIDAFLVQKYDRGEEVNFLERILLQYRLVVTGYFERAFQGYFRKGPNGTIVYDTEPRWDEVRRLIFSNIPAIDDFYRFYGYSPDGYRHALGKMLGASLEHQIPTARANSAEFAKVLFQSRHPRAEGGAFLRVLASYDDQGTAADYMFLHPHTKEEGAHHLTLFFIGSANKWRRRAQLPDRTAMSRMASRAEVVFGLPKRSVRPRSIMTPPWCLDRRGLLNCHVCVGGLAPSYSEWLPYYHRCVTSRDTDTRDWDEQAVKDMEDEFHQL